MCLPPLNILPTLTFLHTHAHTLFLPHLKPHPWPQKVLALPPFWLVGKFSKPNPPTFKKKMDLESVRESLIRQEDTIIFSLIERAKFPINSWMHSHPQNGAADAFSCPSFLHFFVRETEVLHAQAGRYENPEEIPFFPDDLPPSMVPPHDFNNLVLHPAGSSINVNQAIWDVYFNKLLPLFVAEGDDGNYGATAACDLACLQALSRRIHYGKFVAEVKFKDAPEEYGPAIRNQDSEGLMKMLTFEAVEEMVKKRVEKKAMIFGQQVSLSNNNVNANDKQIYKVDPSVVARLYEEWVMPLTKLVEVQYLLRRLD